MICALIESTAENLNNGIIAPLLFLFVGGPVAAVAHMYGNMAEKPIYSEFVFASTRVCGGGGTV